MYLKHPMGNHTPITPERCEELSRAAFTREITPDEETELIQGHLNLLYAIVYKFKVSPEMSDTLVADGLFAMLKGLRDKKLKKDHSFTQLFRLKIRSRILQTLHDQSACQIPRCATGNRKSNGKIYEGRAKLKQQPLPELAAKNDQYDLRELFDKVGDNVFERAIMVLKQSGNSNKQIAERLKMHRVEVQRHLKAIRTKLKATIDA